MTSGNKVNYSVLWSTPFLRGLLRGVGLGICFSAGSRGTEVSAWSLPTRCLQVKAPSSGKNAKTFEGEAPSRRHLSSTFPSPISLFTEPVKRPIFPLLLALPVDLDKIPSWVTFPALEVRLGVRGQVWSGMSPPGNGPAHLPLGGSGLAFVCPEALGSFVFSWAGLFTGDLWDDMCCRLWILEYVFLPSSTQYLSHSLPCTVSEHRLVAHRTNG